MNTDALPSQTSENVAEEKLMSSADLSKAALLAINGAVPQTSRALLDDLKKLAEENGSTKEEATAQIEKDFAAEEALEKRIQEFQKTQGDQLARYIEKSAQRTHRCNDCFYVLQGWSASLFSSSLLTERSRKSTGGFFLRWNGKGIALNPGVGFLENFHRQGLFIQDIDYVVVTGDAAEMYSDVREIYALNAQLNKTQPDLQVIRYYLSPRAHQELAPFLKPHFKQERNAVRSLELFLDSPDVEKIELSGGIILHYFSASRYEPISSHSEPRREKSSALGVKFELQREGLFSEKNSFKLGYLSGIGWSPLLSHYLGACDALVLGFGDTCPSDYAKLKYNDDSLGYFGCYSLLEEIQPSLLICSEFSGREGDIRLEAMQKMRIDYANAHPNREKSPLPIPGDKGLFVDLKTLKVECSLTKKLIAPEAVNVTRTAESFGDLCYLSSSCCLKSRRET